MHGGFAALRRAYPMNLGRRASHAARNTRTTADVEADVARIVALWDQALAITGGPYINGAEAGAVDAMYAPVANRFRGWGVPVPDAAAAYGATILAHPAMVAWQVAADGEPASWNLPHYEAMIDG